MTTMPSETDSVEKAQMPKRKPQQEEKKRWWPIVILVGVGLAILIFGIGIYQYGWDGGATRIISRVVPYPAAIVDGSIIRYSDFQEDVALLKGFYQDEKERAADGSVFPSDAEIEKRVLDRLIKDLLSEKLAKRYGVAVTSADVKTSYESTILDQSSVGGSASEKARAEARAEKTLEDLYGLSSSKFKSRVLYPFLVRRELVDAIQADDELNTEKLKKADEALAAVRGGADFTEVTLVYSEDPNVVNTEGDRGTLGRGLLPKALEDVAFAMSPGEISEVIHSPLGYHIIKVTDVRERDGLVTHVSIKEILIKPISLDDYLEAQKRRVNIVVFVD